jgi:transcriptional regulator GlxA family with amidase domain
MRNEDGLSAAGDRASVGGSRRRTVGYVMFEDMDVLDFGGPYEVFWQARRDGRNEDEYALFSNCTIAQRVGPIRCDGGLTTEAQYTWENHPPIDILLLPGGPGAFRQCGNRALLDWIVAVSQTTEITAGVCTGAFPLAASGLLDGRRATTYWQSIDRFRRAFPRVTVLEHTRFVDEGRLATSAGISAGIDMALRLVERLHGPAVASWTARRIEYDYWRGAPSGRQPVVSERGTTRREPAGV